LGVCYAWLSRLPGLAGVHVALGEAMALRHIRHCILGCEEDTDHVRPSWIAFFILHTLGWSFWFSTAAAAVRFD